MAAPSCYTVQMSLLARHQCQAVLFVDTHRILVQLLWDKGGGTTKMALKFPQLPAANSVDNIWFVAHTGTDESDRDDQRTAKSAQISVRKLCR